MLAVSQCVRRYTRPRTSKTTDSLQSYLYPILDNFPNGSIPVLSFVNWTVLSLSISFVTNTITCVCIEHNVVLFQHVTWTYSCIYSPTIVSNCANNRHRTHVYQNVNRICNIKLLDWYVTRIAHADCEMALTLMHCHWFIANEATIKSPVCGCIQIGIYRYLKCFGVCCIRRDLPDVFARPVSWVEYQIRIINYA